MKAGLPSWMSPLARPPCTPSTQWKTVCPWDTTRSTAPPPGPAATSAAMAPNNSPRSTSSVVTSSIVVAFGGNMAAMRRRKSGGIGVLTAPRGTAVSNSPDSDRSTTPASTAS